MAVVQRTAVSKNNEGREMKYIKKEGNYVEIRNKREREKKRVGILCLFVVGR